jgi:formylglycine-generating enzyme required for sulfatase activity
MLLVGFLSLPALLMGIPRLTAQAPVGSRPRDQADITTLFSGNKFVRISAGEFMMGSTNGDEDEKPAHRVRISQGFEMGKYKVTQAQWEAVMGKNPSHFKGPDLPVETVSWDDAQAFIKQLNERDSKYQYRLPTEAEWEYAARARSTGDYAGDLEAMAWYGNNSENKTHPVGQKQPNAWGLYDMHGNVWEWVQDWYGGGYYAQSPGTDPRGPTSGSYRVNRGGGWGGTARYCRSADRHGNALGNRNGTLGFRLVSTGFCRRARFTDRACVQQAMSRLFILRRFRPAKQTNPATFGRRHTFEDRSGR